VIKVKLEEIEEIYSAEEESDGANNYDSTRKLKR
jgi:hypothetical protein